MEGENNNHIDYTEKHLKEVLSVFRRPIDERIYDTIYEFNLFLITYFFSNLGKINNDTAAELMIIKDSLFAFYILYSLNYFEQACSQLRVSYELVFKLLLKLLPYHNDKIIEISRYLEKELNAGSFIYDHSYYYDIYRELSRPIHGPTPSFLSTALENFPMRLPYDEGLTRKRLFLFLTSCSEILFLGYEKLSVDVDITIQAHLSKFSEDKAKAIAKKHHLTLTSKVMSRYNWLNL